MKKVILFSLTLISSVSMYAQNPLGGVADSVATYVPVVKSVIYGLAGAVAVISCLVIYIKSQNEGYSYKKDVFVAVGSCLFLVFSATALPQFFGLDSNSSSGLLADNSNISSGENGAGGVGNSSDDYIGQPINAAIPGLDDPIWTPEPNTSAYTQEWMEKNGVTSYSELIEEASSEAHQSGNWQAQRGLSQFDSDVYYLLRNNNGDWNKAFQEADSNIAWACSAEANGNQLPYSSWDYQCIYEGLLVAYKYMHGYSYSS